MTPETRARIATFADLLRAARPHCLSLHRAFVRLADAQHEKNGNLRKASHAGVLLAEALPLFERSALDFEEDGGVICNSRFAKLGEQGRIVEEFLGSPSLAELADLFEEEARESEAFLEAIEALEKYRHAYLGKEIKSSEIERSLASKGAQGSDEHRFKVEAELRKVREERDNCQRLLDIMTAQLAQVDIAAFLEHRLSALRQALGRYGASELTRVQHLRDIWAEWAAATKSLARERLA